MNKNIIRFILIYLIFLTLIVIYLLVKVMPSNIAIVQRVIDGDTLVVNYQGKIERIRLLSVDCPELRSKDQNEKRLAEKARDFVKQLCPPGTKIRLEFKYRERDNFGRLLVYAFLPDDKLLNTELLKAGLAVKIK